jgi:hypothetical protein
LAGKQGAGRKGQDSGSYGSPKGRRTNPAADLPLFQDHRHDKSGVFFERLKWKAPQLSTDPIPQPACPYCGKPIKDMSVAIADKNTGEPVHFDCVAARIAEGETLESGDTVAYIGGGRFGIVHFPGMIRKQGNFGSPDGGGADQDSGRRNSGAYDTKNFRIKKIFEWEDKENRAPWRKDIGDHFSVV